MTGRAKKARKYFKGGTMPDGLVLYPLTMGKKELFAEWIEEAGELNEDNLGKLAVYTYAHTLKELEEADGDPVELAAEFLRDQTAEDVERAGEAIEQDFLAMMASQVEAVDSGKTVPGEEGPSPFPAYALKSQPSASD